MDPNLPSPSPSPSPPPAAASDRPAQPSTNNPPPSSSSSAAAAPVPSTAFRSFWTPPAQGPSNEGVASSLYEFQGIPQQIKKTTKGKESKAGKGEEKKEKDGAAAAAAAAAVAGAAGAGAVAGGGEGRGLGTEEGIAGMQSTTAAASSSPPADERVPLLSSSSPSPSSSSIDVERGHPDAGRGDSSSLSWLSRNILSLVLLLFFFSGCFYFVYLFLFPPPIIPIVSDHSVSSICNPFSFPPRPTVHLAQDRGIVAHIAYVPSDSFIRHSNVANVNDYLQASVPLNQTFFFRDLNTPTREFTDRFVAHNREGEGFNIEGEYFYVELHTRITLSGQDKPGMYQFALLSDDGAVVRVGREEGHEEETLVDNDGIHCSRLVVSPHLLSMQPFQSIPTFVQYFQGEAAHISLILLWRRLEGEGASGTHVPPEPLDGSSGNEFFFHVFHNQTQSIPTDNYNQLLSRGWKPLTEDNYILPFSFNGPLRQQIKESVIDPCLTNEQ